MVRHSSMSILLKTLVLTLLASQMDTAVLSRNKTITSSSTYENWVPQRALDGNPRRDARECGCCAVTLQEIDPWYELDLGKRYSVKRIQVEGRDDFPGQHFQGMWIYMKRVSDGIGFGEETRITMATWNVDYVLPVPNSTRYVSLALYNITDYFTVCEMIVYGECAVGESGDYCEGICHCDGDPCNTGVCPSGKCIPGYEGKACDKECTDGAYGPGCTESCGNCLDGTNICNKQNGICPNGCAIGYQGDTCKQQCAGGFYGQGCRNVCGHCEDGTPCHRVTGHCENGCAAGYKQNSLCEMECDPGTYGVGCNETCGNCKDGHGFCAKANGFCSNQCRAGYEGDICKTACDDGTYGENCISNCGKCLNGAACNTKTGVCVGGCSAGNIGDLCVDKCSPGFYGSGCNSTCGNCTADAACHHTDGTCIEGCKIGFKKPLCQEKCDDGTYGENCNSICGNCLNGVACNKKTGVCVGCCSSGYTGDLCIDEIQNDKVDNDYLNFAISGWVCVGIVVLVSAVVIFILMRKLNRANQKEVRTVSRLYEIPTIRNNPVIDEHPYSSTEVNTQDHVYTNTELS